MPDPWSLFRWMAVPVWRLALWTSKHPLLLQPAAWALALGALLAVAFGFQVAGFPALAFVPLAALAIAVLAPLVAWKALTRPSDKTMIFLSRFSGRTEAAEEAGATHLEALQLRLAASTHLQQWLDIRTVRTPMTQSQAARLLDESGARIVVFGEVLAIAGKARWQSDMLIRWRSNEGKSVHMRAGEEPQLYREPQTQKHESIVDPDFPLERLASESFQSDHSDRIEGTLLVLAASEASSAGDDPSARACLEAAERYRASLSVQTRAALEIGRVASDDFDSGPVALDQLEDAGLNDANHVDLWNMLTPLTLLAVVAGEAKPDQLLRRARKAVEADPDNPTARYNLGEAYLGAGDAEAAEEHLAAAASHPNYRDRFYVHFELGIVSYNLRHFETARDAYARAVELEPSARSHLYFADALMALDERGPAHRQYRLALLLDPMSIEASRGYWTHPDDVPIRGKKYLVDWVVPLLGNQKYRQVARLIRPTYLRLLRRHWRRHPEDSRIHFMIGTFTLVEGNYEEARLHLEFALAVVGGVDLEAKARLALLEAFEGNLVRSRELIEEIKNAPPLPRPSGQPEFPRLMLILLPFVDEPRLNGRDHAKEFQQQVTEAFADEIKAIQDRAGQAALD